MGEAVRLHQQGSGRQATQRAHASDWAVFETWCDSVGLCALPAEPPTIAAFLGAQVAAQHAPATLRRRLASIAVRHRREGHPSPCSHDTVRTVMRGVWDDRTAVSYARGPATPLLAADVRAMLSTIPPGPAGTRNRAILLLGFGLGLRRSELAGLTCAALTFESRGLVVQLGRTKTTTAAEGREVSLPMGRDPTTCPVRALQAWLDVSGIEDGPVFRGVSRWGAIARTGITDKAVNDIIQGLATAAGIPTERVSAHSLRSGHITQRRIGGEEVANIQDTTGHRSERMVRHYDRAAKRFRVDVLARLGF